MPLRVVLGCLLSWLGLCAAGCADPAPREEASRSRAQGLAAASSALGTPVLVADINTRPRDILSGDPRGLIALGDTLVFSSLGRLWRSDGTKEGTVRFQAIESVPTSADSTRRVQLGGSLYFAGKGPGQEPGLWRTDGTEAGTVLVRAFSSYEVYELANLDGALYFATVNGPSPFPWARRMELWRSDGTSAGTVRITEFSLPGGEPYPLDLTAAGGTIFFRGNDGAGLELWKTDGTESGTVKVTAIWPSGNADPKWLTVLGDRLYFTATLPDSGTELWRTDGTEAGTQLIRDIRPGSGSSEPVRLTSVGATLYFSADDGTTTGRELWKTDGTAAGTVLVRDLLVSQAHANPSGLAVFQQRLYFSADDGVSGTELWTSDGTAAGTRRVKDVQPGPEGSRPYSHPWTSERLLYFSTVTASGGSALWQTDGTEAGTVPLQDRETMGLIQRLWGSGARVGARQWVFGQAAPETGYELYTSDGTVQGTALLMDIVPGANSSEAKDFASEGGVAWFTVKDPRVGRALWKTDGTLAGTVSVDHAIGHPHDPRWAPNRLTMMNGSLYFLAGDATNEDSLWRTDGTVASTVRVKDPLARQLGGFSINSSLYQVNGLLFFSSFTETGDGSPRNLWRSDGTEAGTFPVTDFTTGLSLSFLSPRLAEPEGWFLFLTESGGTDALTLWQSDGTVAGTHPVPGFPPPGMEPDLRNMVRLGDSLYFPASDGERGVELWKVPVQPPAGRAPGVLRCPRNVLAASEGPAGAIVTWPEATDADGNPFPTPVEYSHASGARFPPGTTRVTATADWSGLLASCAFLVTVADAPPTVTCPPDQVVTAQQPEGLPVSYPSPEAADTQGLVSVTAIPASGSVFTVGTHRVEVTAIDTARNAARCWFQVIVRKGWEDPPPPPPPPPGEEPPPPPPGEEPPPGKEPPPSSGCAAADPASRAAGSWSVLLLLALMVFSLRGHARRLQPGACAPNLSDNQTDSREARPTSTPPHGR